MGEGRDAEMRSVRSLLAGQCIPAIMQLFVFQSPILHPFFCVPEIGIFLRNAHALPKHLIFNFLFGIFALCMNIFLFILFIDLFILNQWV